MSTSPRRSGCAASETSSSRACISGPRLPWTATQQAPPAQGRARTARSRLSSPAARAARPSPRHRRSAARPRATRWRNSPPGSTMCSARSRSGAVSAPTCGASFRPARGARRWQGWPARTRPRASRRLRCSASSISCASRRGTRRPLPRGDWSYSRPRPRQPHKGRPSWCSTRARHTPMATGPRRRRCAACGPTNGSATRCMYNRSGTARPPGTGPTPWRPWSRRRAPPASSSAPSSASARPAIAMGSSRRYGRTACRTSWPTSLPGAGRRRRTPPHRPSATGGRAARHRPTGCRSCGASKTGARRRGGRRSVVPGRRGGRLLRARSP